MGGSTFAVLLLSLPPQVLLYTTMMGGIGALVPLQSRDDADFFSLLEMHLRQENPPLCGRDHLSYRSYYFPVKVLHRGCGGLGMFDPMGWYIF